MLRFALLLALMSAVLPLAACKPAPAPAPAAAALAAAVAVAPVREQAIDRHIGAVGTLVAEESVSISSETAGRLREVAVEDGAAVRKGQLLFALDDAMAQAQLDRAVASHQLAERNASRAEGLVREKLISPQELDQLRAQLALMRAELQLAQTALAQTRILAPFDGVVGIRQRGPGDYVAAGDSLISLQKLQPIKLEFRVPELQLAQIARGQTVELTVDAFPDAAFSGQIYAMDPQIASDSRSLLVRARLDNRDQRLRPGQFARVRIVTGRAVGVLTVAEGAIVPRGDQQLVYVLHSDANRGDTVEERSIQVGQRQDGRAEVLAGLAAGEQVVAQGVHKLRNGSPVRVIAD